MCDELLVKALTVHSVWTTTGHSQYYSRHSSAVHRLCSRMLSSADVRRLQCAGPGPSSVRLANARRLSVRVRIISAPFAPNSAKEQDAKQQHKHQTIQQQLTKQALDDSVPMLVAPAPLPPSPVGTFDAATLWSLVSGTPAFASQLLTHFRLRMGALQAEQVLAAASRAERKEAAVRRPADLRKFLHPVGVWEMKHIRKLSSLAALTYNLSVLTPSALLKRHDLELIATSLACELRPVETARSSIDVAAEGDGMAASPGQLESFRLAKAAAAERRARAYGASSSNVVAVPKELTRNLRRSTPVVPSSHDTSTASGAVGLRQQQQWKLPADVVAARLAEAAAAASAAAAAASAVAVSPLASAAGSLFASLPMRSRSKGSTPSASLPLPSALGQTTAQGNMPAAGSAAVSVPESGPVLVPAPAVAFTSVAAAGLVGTAATAVAISTATAGSVPGDSTVVASGSTLLDGCPSAWFVCDDLATDTRFFVIQGSDTLDHWKLNLTFDPVIFEDPALGVKVHRGVLDGAKALYDRFLPLVYEHLDSSACAKVSFTGHSIGGSLATLLVLLYASRGILTASSLATTYTFGAPAVFCELGPSSMHIEDGEAGSSSGSGGVLAKLGLPEDSIRNVIMHRDIVPRAFACDYSLIADMLRTFGQSFREQPSLLLDGRKHLYYFIGKMMVLQPDNWHGFAQPEPYHPMLPAGGGLYLLDCPTRRSTVAAGMCQREDQQTGQVMGREVATVPEAVYELMDNPHPLTLLGDPGAYLPHGSMSRYHNPDNYTRAIGRVIHLQRSAERSTAARQQHSSSAAAANREYRRRWEQRRQRWQLECEAGYHPAEEELAVWDSSDGELLRGPRHELHLLDLHP